MNFELSYLDVMGNSTHYLVSLTSIFYDQPLGCVSQLHYEDMQRNHVHSTQI